MIVLVSTRCPRKRISITRTPATKEIELEHQQHRDRIRTPKEIELGQLIEQLCDPRERQFQNFGLKYFEDIFTRRQIYRDLHIL